MTTRPVRIRFYAIGLILVTASVPFLHLYMSVQLSLAELIIHTSSIVVSTAIAVLLFELTVWIYLRREARKWNISIGLFWMLLFGVFSLSFIVMTVTHDFLPITLDIWNKHIKHDLGTIPWKIVPVVLLIGYILTQLIRRYQAEKELADLKKLNEQLHAVRKGIEPPDNDIQVNRNIDISEFLLPYEGENLLLNPALIIRIESNGNYCHIQTAPNTEQGEHCYMARITLSEALKQLQENIFLQVHRSHIVNFNYVSSLVRQDRNYQLQLTNGDYIPVSRSRLKQIRHKVLKSTNNNLAFETKDKQNRASGFFSKEEAS